MPPTKRAPPLHIPAYDAAGGLLPSPDYREWIYLSSGLDMNYTPRAQGAVDHSTFGNVFVNPEAYRSFREFGTWPDKTTLILEFRGAESNASINRAGRSEGRGVTGIEVHVKDVSRGGWSFYEFSSDAPAKRIPQQADCYTCHRDHAAVDTTFVQFYPTLLPIAEAKNTLSPAYTNELAKPTK